MRREEARRCGYVRLSVETSAMDYFEPVWRLYAKDGFEECPPFGNDTADPNSVFTTRRV